MSFTLIDLESANNEFPVSMWHWRTAVAVIKDLDVIDEFVVKRMSDTASGIKVEKEQAHALGRKIKEELLPRLFPDRRIFENLTITDEPDDGTMHGSDGESWRNFSADHDWFEDFSDFCLRSGGFQVY